MLTRTKSIENLLDFPFPFSLENTETKDHCSPGTPDHLEDHYSLVQHHQFPHKKGSWAIQISNRQLMRSTKHALKKIPIIG